MNRLCQENKYVMDTGLTLELKLGQNTVTKIREGLLLSKAALARRARVSPLTIERIEKEIKMIDFEKDRFRKRAPKLLETLKKRGFDGYFFETAPEARDFIENQIVPEETVGIGGSITIREALGVAEALRAKGITVFDHWTAGSPEQRLELKRKHRSVDVFLTSMNAITGDGIMVNLDGGGNRVASTCSGPKRVIVAVGANKVAESLDSAIERTRHHAAVINSIRLDRKTPCAETGVCNDCSSPHRICAALLILYKKPSDIDKFTVVLVNEEMGY